MRQRRAVLRQVRRLASALLCGKDVEIRETAAYSLSLLGPQAAAAVPALLKALDDPFWDVTTRAIQALEEIGGPAQAALPGLRRFARRTTDPITRAYARLAIAEIQRQVKRQSLPGTQKARGRP